MEKLGVFREIDNVFAVKPPPRNDFAGNGEPGGGTSINNGEIGTLKKNGVDVGRGKSGVGGGSKNGVAEVSIIDGNRAQNISKSMFRARLNQTNSLTKCY